MAAKLKITLIADITEKLFITKEIFCQQDL